MPSPSNTLTRSPTLGSVHRNSPRCDPDVELVEWDGPNDPGNPMNWSKKKKWIITIVALFATFTTMLNGTIITVAHKTINDKFAISDANFPHSYWPVTSWALGGALFSFLILPIMEDFGIRYVFLGTYLVFVCFTIPQAVAQNFATLIVTRFFAGGCAAILANTVASVIGNVWEDERGRTVPMSLYVTAYLTGSSMGPVIGSSIFQFLSWRWISYLQLIWYGALFVLYFLLFPESRGSAILARRAQELRKKGRKAYTALEMDPTPMSQVMVISIKRPLQMLFTEAVVFVISIMSGLIVGTVYVFTQSVEQVFVDLYGWSVIQAGYVQTAIVIGELLGWTGSLLSAKLYFASAARNTEIPGTPIPEARLYMAIPGAFLGMTGGMFVYAWTSYPSLPWIAPAIGLAMVGAGNEIVIIAIADYITDAYSKYAGSAIAAMALCENTFAAFLPLAAQNIYTNLGFQWASSVLGFVSLALAFAPVILVIWGRNVRARSPFMEEASSDRKKESNISR